MTHEINITSRFEIWNHNISIGYDMDILFDIKLEPHFVCKAKRCNIFHIGNTVSIKLPSMYIVNDDIEIYMFTYHDADLSKYTIPNAAKLLCDGEYHRIHLSIQNKDIFGWFGDRKLLIDNITYLWTEEWYNYEGFIGRTYPIYVSNPWEESVGGVIKNLCIDSSFDPRNMTWILLKKPKILDLDNLARSGFGRQYSFPLAYYDERMIAITSFEIYQETLTARDLAIWATDHTLSAHKSVKNEDKSTLYSTVYYNYSGYWNHSKGLESITGRFKEYIQFRDALTTRGAPLIMHSQQFIQDEDKLYILMQNGTSNVNPGVIMQNGTSNESVSDYVSDYYENVYSKIYIFDLIALQLESISIIPREYYPDYPDFALDSCITTNH
eukprot:996186_1